VIIGYLLMNAQKFSGCLAVPSSLSPQASRLLRLFGFSPEGDTRTAGVRKPPDCVFSIGLMIVE
jgi:hypothetical protein